MNDGTAPDSKRQKSELAALLQEINSTHRELGCAASDAADQSVAVLNNAFQRLVSEYLQPSTGSSFFLLLCQPLSVNLCVVMS